jgi:probable HAF family extracellular repeat protein
LQPPWTNGQSPACLSCLARGAALDLGAVSGDCFSRAGAINAKSQIVGNSFACSDVSFDRAFLWERGSIVDLNAVIPAGSTLQLTFANDINDRGEIAGMGVPSGVDPSTVLTLGHAFLLIPCDEQHAGVEGCDYSMVDSATTVSRPSPLVDNAIARTWPQPDVQRGYRLHSPSVQLVRRTSRV